jgi:hypothetical protein
MRAFHFSMRGSLWLMNCRSRNSGILKALADSKRTHTVPQPNTEPAMDVEKRIQLLQDQIGRLNREKASVAESRDEQA